MWALFHVWLQESVTGHDYDYYNKVEKSDQTGKFEPERLSPNVLWRSSSSVSSIARSFPTSPSAGRPVKLCLFSDITWQIRTENCWMRREYLKSSGKVYTLPNSQARSIAQSKFINGCWPIDTVILCKIRTIKDFWWHEADCTYLCAVI